MLRSSLVRALVVLVVFAVVAPADAQSTQYYVLDGFGGVHVGGGASVIVPGTPYFGFDVAQDIVYVPFGASGSHGDGILVLDRFGGVHQGGLIPNSSVNPRPPYFGFDIARAITYRNIPPRLAGGVVSNPVTISTATSTPLVSITIEAPDDGFLLVNASSSILCSGTTGAIILEVSLGIDTTTGAANTIHFADFPDCSDTGPLGFAPSESLSMTGFFPVSAGQHSVHLVGRRFAGNTSGVASNNWLTVLFVDQDRAGGS